MEELAAAPSQVKKELTACGRTGVPTSAAYARLVASAREALSPQAVAAQPRTRPLQRPARKMRTSCDGGPFVKPAHLRLCDESVDKCRHVLQSKAVPFPQPSSRYELTSDCLAAIRTMASMSGADLSKWRARQVRVLAKIADKAKRMSHDLFHGIQNVPASVKFLRRSINVCFIAVLCDAMQWPDVDICRELTQGFATAGDLRMQDSHVFRPGDFLEEVVGTAWHQVAAPEDSRRAVSCQQASLLAALAAGQRRFSPDALDEMKVSGLTWDSLALAGGNWYQPTVPALPCRI